MATDTPVLERRAAQATKKQPEYLVPTRMDVIAEEEHNARIRDNYARLVNPNSSIDDVFAAAEKEEAAVSSPVQQAAARPYLVENARANADIFRADSAINRVAAAPVMSAETDEEEDEDLRPTATTIQYRTIDRTSVNVKTGAKTRNIFGFDKKQKIIIAVCVAIVVALISLIVVNSVIIANLNNEIAQVQSNISVLRGALAGVNDRMGDIISNGLGS